MVRLVGMNSRRGAPMDMDIAAAVDRLLEDSELAKKIGENAGSFAYEHFRWEKVFAVYKEIGV